MTLTDAQAKWRKTKLNHFDILIKSNLLSQKRKLCVCVSVRDTVHDSLTPSECSNRAEITHSDQENKRVRGEIATIHYYYNSTATYTFLSALCLCLCFVVCDGVFGLCVFHFIFFSSFLVNKMISTRFFIRVQTTSFRSVISFSSVRYMYIHSLFLFETAAISISIELYTINNFHSLEMRCRRWHCPLFLFADFQLISFVNDKLWNVSDHNQESAAQRTPIRKETPHIHTHTCTHVYSRLDQFNWQLFLYSNSPHTNTKRWRLPFASVDNSVFRTLCNPQLCDEWIIITNWSACYSWTNRKRLCNLIECDELRFSVDKFSLFVRCRGRCRRHCRRRVTTFRHHHYHCTTVPIRSLQRIFGENK